MKVNFLFADAQLSTSTEASQEVKGKEKLSTPLAPEIMSFYND